MSKQTKLLNLLVNGASVTSRQIQSTFGLKNPHSAIYELRKQGHCIYANKTVLADGTETVKYRIGKPSKRMVALASRIVGAKLFSN